MTNNDLPGPWLKAHELPEEPAQVWQRWEWRRIGANHIFGLFWKRPNELLVGEAQYEYRVVERDSPI